MKIPSEQDWGIWRADLDESAAHQTFSGKTIAEAERLFSLHSAAAINRADELRSMPPIPFRYYILAFRDFVLSAMSKANADGASCYLHLLRDKLKWNPAAIVPVMPALLSSVKAVAERQSFYEAPISIYGSFPDLRDEVLRLYESST
jgi:hypothetical protein